MTIAIDRAKKAMASNSLDNDMLSALFEDVDELEKKASKLEELLIVLVRTGWPWDEDGEPNEIFHTCRDGFTSAIAEAKILLCLDTRSTITRTEPKT